MSSTTTKRVKRKCPVCNTTKIKPTDDYGLVCKYGHKILGIQKEEQDDTPVVPRITRKRKRNIVEYEVITASKRRTARVRVIQFSLKVVVRTMVQDLGFPPELEHIARELWLVVVSALNIELDNSYLFKMKENERNESKGSGHTSNDNYKEDNPDQLLSDQSDIDDGEEEEKEKGRAKVELNKNNNEEKEDDKLVHEDKMAQKSKKSIDNFNLQYIDVLALVYLSCIYLRLPILHNDLVRWCLDDSIPYTSLQNKLPQELFNSITLNFANTMVLIPPASRLSQRTMELAKYVLYPQGLIMPQYNISLYLDRFCSQFYLPVEAYYLSLFLFKKHQLPCNLTISKEEVEYRSITKKIMACVVCAIKMLYSLDHSTDFQDNSSVYDINTTRGKWIDLIKENIKSWEQYKEMRPENDTNTALRMIKNSSILYEYATPFKVKKDLFRNFINRRLDIPHTIPEKQVNLDNSFINPRDKNTSDDQIAATVQPEGHFYYMYKFGLRPTDYYLVINLACLVLGETSVLGLERLVTLMDKEMSTIKRTEKFNIDPVSNRYPLYDVALENLFGTKFFPSSFV